MSRATAQAPVDAARRIEELGRIIMAYSEVTEKLQQSHDRLQETVLSLRQELGEKNRQLERRNRLAALGEMAAGLAHEIRNPLGGIQLYASLLEKETASLPEAAALARKISGGVRRLEALVRHVLQFTRQMTAQIGQADLAEVVDAAVESASAAAQGRGAMVQVQGPRPMSVRVDAVLMTQAVANLILNAAEAMEGGGRVRVSYGPDDSGSGGQFRLSVEDDGPGIPSEAMERIFNPFFTTKEAGTGLGLAIVHRIVEAHEGTITACNVPGGGARFEMRI